MPTPQRSRALRVAKIIFAVAVVVAIAYGLYREWGALRAATASAHPRWGYIALSAAIVLANYALLIQAWRGVLGGWSASLPFWESARIWCISNLGRYVPGKVWQLGSMAMMTQERGVSGVAAVGSALVVTLVNTVVGFVVLAATGASVLHVPPIAVAAIAAAGVGLLLAPSILPHLADLLGRVTRRSISIRRMPHRVILIAALICGVAWVAYGVAFRVLAIGVLGRAPGATGTYVAVFTGSYLAGFLALIAPGGVGVRELVMGAALKQAGFGTGEAILLVVASRVWLTVLEIVPPILFLAHRWVRRIRSNGPVQVSH